MNNGLTPIQTSYKGYRFRSRLEARWAVFFDAARLSWDYEPEGFQLDSGWYLPDFFIETAKGCFVEIKPNVHLTVSHARCAELSRVSGTPVLLIEGKPWPLEYWARLFVDGIAFNDVQFSQGRRCESEIWLSNETVAHCLNPISDDDRWPVEFSEFTLNAFRAARAARFEHGETPNQTLQVRFEDR